MFWKRKTKKKDDDAGGADVASTTVTTKDADEEDGGPRASDNESEPTTAEASGEDATDTDDEGELRQPEDDAASTDSAATETAEKTVEKESSGDTDPAEETSDEVDSEEEESENEHIQCVHTEGTLRTEDVELAVVSNTWIVEVDEEGVLVIDPAHDAKAILEAVGDREIYLVACTNGYNTHTEAAVEVAERDEAPIALHRKELRSWRRVHGAERRPDHEIEGGGALHVGDVEIDILPIPGTSSGSVAYYIPDLGAVFSGDILRKGELGTVGGGHIDYTGQLASVGEVLFGLSSETRVFPDTGETTTVAAEHANFDSWVTTN